MVRYARDWIVEIEDITNFLKTQKGLYVDQGKLDQLETPQEALYFPEYIPSRGKSINSIILEFNF